MDFGSMNMKQLKALKRDVEKEIERRTSADRKKALEDVRALLTARGLKLDDLMEGKRKPNPAMGKAVRTEKKTRLKRGPAKIKYRHPENAALTWTGRGRQPKWVVEWMSGGNTLEMLAV